MRTQLADCIPDMALWWCTVTVMYWLYMNAISLVIVTAVFRGFCWQ